MKLYQKIAVKCLACALSIFVATACCGEDVSAPKVEEPLSQIPFQSVTLEDNFWLPRLQNLKEVLVPFAFEKTEYAARLKATGVITSYICPLMYMNNPLCKAMPVMTCSNKLRTYTTARYYTEAEILEKITKGGN